MLSLKYKNAPYPFGLYCLLALLIGGIRVGRNSSLGLLTLLVKCYVCHLFVFPIPAVGIELLNGLFICHACHFVVSLPAVARSWSHFNLSDDLHKHVESIRLFLKLSYACRATLLVK
jgi:hypothetical protein